MKNQKKSDQRLSVLMFYNDGLSHAMSRRVLNQTYYYLLYEQEGLPLDSFHGTALNTLSNLVPYLTGEKSIYSINQRSKMGLVFGLGWRGTGCKTENKKRNQYFAWDMLPECHALEMIVQILTFDYSKIKLVLLLSFVCMINDANITGSF